MNTLVLEVLMASLDLGSVLSVPVPEAGIAVGTAPRALLAILIAIGTALGLGLIGQALAPIAQLIKAIAAAGLAILLLGAVIAMIIVFMVI